MGLTIKYIYVLFFFVGKRKIRVFITYSQDDKRHTQRVINLCDCLRKNNFQPCIDMFEKVKIAQDKHGWIDKKFKEVCLMNLYSACCFQWIAQVDLTKSLKVDL